MIRYTVVRVVGRRGELFARWEAAVPTRVRGAGGEGPVEVDGVLFPPGSEVRLIGPVVEVTVRAGALPRVATLART